MRLWSSVVLLPILGLITGFANAESLESANTASNLHRDPFKQPKLLEEPEKADEPDVSEVIKVAPPWMRELRATMVAGQSSMANVDGILARISHQASDRRPEEV